MGIIYIIMYAALALWFMTLYAHFFIWLHNIIKKHPTLQLNHKSFDDPIFFRWLEKNDDGGAVQEFFKLNFHTLKRLEEIENFSISCHQPWDSDSLSIEWISPLKRLNLHFGKKDEDNTWCIFCK